MGPLPNTYRWILAISLTGALIQPLSARAEDCREGSYDSTFELIQDVVFEKYGCNTSVCHGVYAAGGLDLSPAVAYRNLVDQVATTVPGISRLLPGQKDQSLLWLNLAAKTLPEEVHAPLRPMPLDPVPALTPDHLELMRAWIEAGAPETGTVAAAVGLVDACLPAPEPLTVEPLPPPAPGEGVQVRMPPYELGPQSERETCFASWIDLTDQVPEQYRGADGSTFRFKLNRVRQTPMSHHLIVSMYEGNASPDDDRWGEFFCAGGDKHGQRCAPTDLAFCGEGLCSTIPSNSIACTGFGPGDSGLGIASSGFSGTQETASEFRFAEGVYGELPMRGMVLWNSHVFNLTDKPGTLEAWLNFEFAEPEEQLYPARTIFDAKDIFATNAPAFSSDEPCSLHELPRNAHLFELSSHGHRHMKRWRTYIGAFTCQGGPAVGQACSPLGYDFESRDVCEGFPCAAPERAHVGDCDTSGDVTVDEVLTAANIALGSSPIGRCVDADRDFDDVITVDELLTAVSAALTGVPATTLRDASDSLVYTSLIYNDPVVLRFDDAPMVFRSHFPEERTLTYCALFDNGLVDPSEVKRRSTSPPPPAEVLPVGGPCDEPTHCTEGKVGEPCVGRTERARHASCDSTPGAGDGMCDACTLTGGVTTEDEMFILMGQFYVP